jgi:hypothetical protein
MKTTDLHKAAAAALDHDDVSKAMAREFREYRRQNDGAQVPKGLPEWKQAETTTDPDDPLKRINPRNLWSRKEVVTGSGRGPRV